ncbi:hypothetical protein [Alcanivorax sp. 1008]|uniref:hypothetical protein n=1 Tax=Alcanivorax sp. 1008 TaxID=2816853 RepID=UPI001D34FB5A|nr:hypothetical protein [Alcanivorax sp. 1008]MCC1495369.1 hypothetical protein [Alcanivorax sp. 1008]
MPDTKATLHIVLSAFKAAELREDAQQHTINSSSDHHPALTIRRVMDSLFD